MRTIKLTLLAAAALLLSGCAASYVDPYGTFWVWDPCASRYLPADGNWYRWNPWVSRGYWYGRYDPSYPYWGRSWIRNPYAVPPPPPRGQEWRFEDGQWKLYHKPWGWNGPAIPNRPPPNYIDYDALRYGRN